MSRDPRGLRVLVTGASGTFGRAICSELGGLGASVIGLDVAPGAEDPVPVIACDLTDDAAVPAAVEQAIDTSGRPRRPDQQRRHRRTSACRASSRRRSAAPARHQPPRHLAGQRRLRARARPLSRAGRHGRVADGGDAASAGCRVRRVEARDGRLRGCATPGARHARRRHLRLPLGRAKPDPRLDGQGGPLAGGQ